jgi:uncharacterized protein (DUF1778 family)
MLTKLSPKRDRMHLRLDSTSKRKLERAAAYAERTVSEFVLSQALAAAEQVIESHEQHVLSTADWETFCKALDRPPRPNKALKQGFRWYRETAD